MARHPPAIRRHAGLYLQGNSFNFAVGFLTACKPGNGQ